MASFLQSFIDPRKNWFARQHMKAISTRLRHYGSPPLSETLCVFCNCRLFRFDVSLNRCWKLGLRYDDLYDPYYDLDIKEALKRLPREIVDARNQRLKRAMDLSMKHEYLPEDLQVHFDFTLFQFPIIFISTEKFDISLLVWKQRVCISTAYDYSCIR